MKTVLKMALLCFAFLSVLACNANSKKQNKLYTFKSVDSANKQFIKVALLLDTSNSMDGLIDQAKAQLWEIVNELSYAKCGNEKPNLEIALYEYGNDGLNGNEGYIRQVLKFSDDLDEISKELFSLTTNGGNEFCGQVIQTSLNQLNWGSNPDDLKLIFIAGNEPFTQGRISYKDATTNAKEKDVTVNTIFCGDYNQGISSYWKDGADLTNGNYMAINHNKATVHIASPYDDAILKLNKQLNNTYIGFGKRGKAKKLIQAEQDVNASGYSKANAVGRTISKSSHLYKNATWDLVDAVELEEVVIEDLDKGDLPNYLQDKTTEEIKAHVSKKQKERKQIKNEIQELNIKRKTYISKKQTNANNGLENAMTKAIKTQAKKKKYTW